jgi:hypothetical protein
MFYEQRNRYTIRELRPPDDLKVVTSRLGFFLMPRGLIITFCYAPTQVIGSLRPAGLAKYLPQFGWDVIVLTPKINRSAGDPRIIETEYRN